MARPRCTAEVSLERFGRRPYSGFYLRVLGSVTKILIQWSADDADRADSRWSLLVLIRDDPLCPRHPRSINPRDDMKNALGLWRLSIRHFIKAITASLNEKESLYETDRFCLYLPIRFKQRFGADHAHKSRRPVCRTARRQGLHRRRSLFTRRRQEDTGALRRPARRRRFGRDGQGGVELDRADESRHPAPLERHDELLTPLR